MQPECSGCPASELERRAPVMAKERLSEKGNPDALAQSVDRRAALSSHQSLYTMPLLPTAVDFDITS